MYRFTVPISDFGIVIWASPEAGGGDVITDVNDAFCGMLGYSRTQLIGRSMTEFVHPDSARHDLELREQMNSGMVASSVWEARYVHAAGHSLWLRFSTTTVEAASGRRVIAHVENVTERKDAELRLVHQAFHDGLTGLPNRHLAFDRLRLALARLEREDAVVAVLYVDLDWFKVINDRFGHAAGDRVLIETGRRLRSVLRSPDTVARLGGDEFMVICTATSALNGNVESTIASLAARVTEALAVPIQLDDDTQISTSASVGVAITRLSSEDPDDLLHSADAAMYRAKQHGRARFELFDEELRTRAVGRLTLERELHGAAERGEFAQYFQPIVDLSSCRILGLEALLRWQRPDTGLLAAAEFIDIAEESGLIVDLGDWTLTAACNQQAAWRGLPEGNDLFVAVNLSGREASMTNVKDRILAAAEATGADLAHLAIELTETVFLDTVQSFLFSLRSLQELGVKIILDDFGTGFSSLTYLRRFPVTALKIDRSFIAGLGIDQGDTSIVKSVIALGHSLHLTVIAEGVEKPVQLDMLRELGCDAAQGYLLGLPLSASATTQLLATASSDRPAPD